MQLLRRRALTGLVVSGAVVALLVAGRLIARTLPEPTSTTFIPLVSTFPPTTLPPDTQPNGQPRQVRLAGGAASAHYPVQAVDPAIRSVQLSIRAPVGARVRVWLEPEPGLPLGAISTSDRTWCRRNGQQQQCSLEHESGLGPPGAWTLHVAKESGPALLVTVTVTFRPAG